MKKKKMVIALGHEAVGEDLPEQKKAARKAAEYIASIVEDDCQIAITHSNGPQVGMIHTAMSELHRLHKEYSPTPMSVCAAMSQGYIGYDLQNSIRAALVGKGIYRNVVTVLTQTIVDPYDEAFYEPTKIIGRVMSEDEAKVEEEKGNHVVAVEGGFRRIVPAPKPVAIVEIDAIKTLMEAGQVVIAAGGGGIPVLRQGDNLQGASAVIEKDLIAGTLADELDADQLVILTDVDTVCTGFGTKREKPIRRMTCEEAYEYAKAGEFLPGTMLPKIRAAIGYIKDSKTREVLITRLSSLDDARAGKCGTVIKNS